MTPIDQPADYAAKGGFVVAETTGEAHMKVTFEWNRTADPSPAPSTDHDTGSDRPADSNPSTSVDQSNAGGPEVP